MSLDDPSSRDRLQHARTGLLANFLMVAGSGYFELATGLVRSVWVMRILGPTGVGLTNIVLLIERYTSNCHLGVLHGITKRLPVAIGSGDERGAQMIEDVGVTWVLATSAVTAVGVFIAALVWPDLGPMTRMVIALGAPIFLCDQACTLYRIVARSWQVYRPIVVASVVLSLGLTVFMVLGAWGGGPPGAMLGWLLATALTVAALSATVRLAVRLRLDWPMLKDLLRTGLPLAAMAFGDTLLITADTFVLLRRGATVFGLYSGIALQTRRYMFNLVRALSFVLMPHLLEEYSKHRSLSRLRATAIEPTAALALGVPLLAVVTAAFLPPAARMLVPRFYAGVPAGQIVAFGTCLMTLPLALSMCLIVLNREWEAVAGQAVGGLTIAAFAWAPSAQGDLTGTAIAAALGSWAMTLCIGINALGRLGDSLPKALFTIGVLHVPLAWALGAWFLTYRLTAPLPRLHADSWLGALLRLAIIVLLMSPLLIYGARRFHVLRRVAGVVRALRRRGSLEPGEPQD